MSAVGNKVQKKEHKNVAPYKDRPKKDIRVAKKEQKNTKALEEEDALSE